MSLKKVLKIFGWLVFLSLPLLVIQERQAIFDWWRLRSYTPTKKIVQLSEQTTMNSSARRLFYVYHPEINDKTTFNTNCRENERTIILGCYVNGQGIYILDVTDKRLSGVQQVTAAHELLHAAYARLSKADKTEVDAMTKATYAKVTSKRIKNTVKLYREKDPSSIPNELHSILGTEVKSLPKDLEKYYERYFTNRTAIVKYAQQYESAFTIRQQQLESYNSQLKALKKQIDSYQASLPAERARIEADRARVNALAESGDKEAYEKAAAEFRADVFAYNSKVDRLNSLIAQYNAIIPKANALLSEEKELLKAIDSRN